MLPHEHFLVAALPIFGYILLRHRRLPSKAMTFVVFVGSQFPDIIDKPLAHSAGFLPSGRVFMHSLPFAVPIAIGILAYGFKTDRPHLSIGFVWAYAAHIVADWYPLFLNGQLPPNLFWPFMPPLPSEAVPGWAGPGAINVSLWTMVSIVILAATILLVAMDISVQLLNKPSNTV